MDKLQPMPCRICQTMLVPRRTETGIRAHSYQECFYECKKCRVAYSNSKDPDHRTLIYDKWERNIPSEVHQDLFVCIDRSLNERSRPKKKGRLAFCTSEDAVTWTVFRYLQQKGQLGIVFGMNSPRVLYWGAEYPATSKSAGAGITESLRTILLKLGENPLSLSEPDIVLIDDETVCTIEVKYFSTNSDQKDHRRFPSYLAAVPGTFKTPEAVAPQGYYELTRNVVFTQLLSQALKRQWRVLNIGLDRCRTSAGKFRDLLRKPSAFEFQRWPDICSRIPQPRDKWFEDYLRKKGLE